MYGYLIDKIRSTKLKQSPFPFLYIENFFNSEHFNMVVNHRQVQTSENSLSLLHNRLLSLSYKPISFPGTTTDFKKYQEWYENGAAKIEESKAFPSTSGFGITYRLQQPDEDLKQLIDFFGDNEFIKAIRSVFPDEKPVYYEGGLQKYLDKYEISPHPDIRNKSLTWMLNLNPHFNADSEEIHTHFMEYKEDKQWVEKFFDENTDKDRCWIPWQWAQTKFIQRTNNSLTMFAPSSKTLHAINLNYNHLPYQRTQIYGNLWYSQKSGTKRIGWRDIKENMEQI